MSDSQVDGVPAAKKRRAANFTEEELILIVQGVAERKVVLLGPLPSVVTNKSKTLSWKAVTEAVNSVGRIQREENWFNL